MIRGSTFSAILHGSLIALVLYGMPHFVFEREPTISPSAPPEAPAIEVATVTAEQAEAIAEAAARPLTERAPQVEGGRPNLTTDAVNTVDPEDRQTILQSASASRAPAQPEQSPLDEQSVVEPPKTETSPVEPPPAPRPDISKPTLDTAPAQRQAAENLPRQERAETSEQRPQQDARQAQTPEDAATPERREATAQNEAAEQRDKSTQANSSTQTEASEAAAPSGSARLATGDAAARSVALFVATVPLLETTVGEIFAAREAGDAAVAKADAPALTESIKRMTAAAEQGYAHAQYTLAELYLTGKGVPRDEEKGLQYLERASLNGYLPAQLLNGVLAAEGSLVPRDLGEAHAWLSLAAEQGYEAAAKAAAQIEPQMTARDSVRARQRRSQLRQVFVLSKPKSADERKTLDEKLRVATTLGDVEAVFVLLAQGSDANKTDEDGRSASIEAAWRGYIAILDRLIEQGADLSQSDRSGKNALMWAAINGHTVVAERLLAAGIPINARDGEGLTALMRAAWNGHDATVRLLLQSKADPRLRDNAGRSAIDYARESRRAGIVALLEAASRS